MKMDLIRPCAQCPFRTDIPGFLSATRMRQILHAILREDATFSCHKTNEYDHDGVRETSSSQHCAGALILLERQNRPNQWMRIAERIGCYDRTRLDMDAPVGTPRELVAHHGARQEAGA